MIKRNLKNADILENKIITVRACLIHWSCMEIDASPSIRGEPSSNIILSNLIVPFRTLPLSWDSLMEDSVLGSDHTREDTTSMYRHLKNPLD